MADINKIDLTDVQDSQKGLYQLGFELTSYVNGTTIELEASRSEYIGQSPYRVEDGNLPVTGSPSDGAVYLYITEDGDDTASATLSNTVPTYSPTNGGFYDGLSRALFVFTKSGSNYNDRYKMTDVNKDLGCQIGQLIDIHPETIKKPNAFNFALCDGGTVLPASSFTKVNDTNTPNLANKYLKSGSAYGTGGANTVNLEHSHTVDSHSHIWLETQNNNTRNNGFDASGNTEVFTQSTAGPGDADDYAMAINAKNSGNRIGDGVTFYTNKQSPGTNNQLSSTQTNEPEYFVSLKYMRII